MKKLIISLVVSAPLLLTSAASFAENVSVSYQRFDSSAYVQPVGNYSEKAVVGTQYAYWHRWHRWHRWHPWHRWHRWHRWY